jgi:hypothetical protein
VGAAERLVAREEDARCSRRSSARDPPATMPPRNPPVRAVGRRGWVGGRGSLGRPSPIGRCSRFERPANTFDGGSWRRFLGRKLSTSATPAGSR